MCHADVKTSSAARAHLTGRSHACPSSAGAAGEWTEQHGARRGQRVQAVHTYPACCVDRVTYAGQGAFVDSACPAPVAGYGARRRRRGRRGWCRRGTRALMCEWTRTQSVAESSARSACSVVHLVERDGAVVDAGRPQDLPPSRGLSERAVLQGAAAPANDANESGSTTGMARLWVWAVAVATDGV